MTFTDKINQSITLLCEAFAEQLAQHKLSARMTAKQIMDLIDLESLLVSQPSAKASPGTKGKKGDLPRSDRDIGKIPEEAKISEGRALELLYLAEQGVPEGMFIHTGNRELFKPNKQHELFYKEYPFAGPKKDKAAIKWLVKLAGDVGPPPEPEVVPKIPDYKFKGDKKKVLNLLKIVQDHKKEATKEDKDYESVNWTTSRGRKQDDDSLVYNAKYGICGPKEYKADFLNLIAWLDENPEFVESAQSDDEKPKTAKGKKSKSSEDDEKPKATKGKKVSEPDESESEEEKPKATKGKKLSDPEESDSEEEQPKGKKVSDESESEDEKPKTKASGKKVSAEPESDDDVDDKVSGEYVLDYDQAKVAKAKEKMDSLIAEGSEKFYNFKTKAVLGKPKKGENKFLWIVDEDNGLKMAIPIEYEYMKDDILAMFARV